MDITTTPPEFVKAGGRQPSETNLAIRALEVGEWVDVEREPTEKNLANIRQMAYKLHEVEGFETRKFSVRTAADESTIWVGRTA